MIIKNVRPELAQSHSKLIFTTIDMARRKSLANVIGRFDSKTSTASFLADGELGTKYNALYQAGMQIHLADDGNGNFYLTDLVNVIGENVVESEHHLNSFYESVSDNALDGEITFMDREQFLAEDIDSYLPIQFTSPKLKHSFTIGHISAGGSYTLNEDCPITKYSPFELEEVLEEGEIVGLIDNSTMKAKEFLVLEKWALERDNEEGVNVAALTQVQKLLARIRLEQKHGLADDMKESIAELNLILKPYEKSSPPAEGLADVRAALDSIISNDNDIVAESIKWLSNQGRFL